jgi:hypothetical protein
MEQLCNDPQVATSTLHWHQDSYFTESQHGAILEQLPEIVLWLESYPAMTAQDTKDLHSVTAE